jgi:hypothetical protein
VNLFLKNEQRKISAGTILLERMNSLDLLPTGVAAARLINQVQILVKNLSQYPNSKNQLMTESYSDAIFLFQLK